MSDRVGSGLPTARCGLCKADIYDSVETAKIECGLCVQRKIKHIQRLEKQSGIYIRNKFDYAAARNRCQGKSIIIDKPKTALRSEESPKPIPTLKPIEQSELI